MSGNRPQLLRLYEADPHCHWCGIETVLPPAEGGYPNRGKMRMATRDHLVSKILGDPLARGSEIVLACHRCNLDRAYAEAKEVDPEVMRRRSHPDKYGYTSLRHALQSDPNYLSVAQ